MKKRTDLARTIVEEGSPPGEPVLKLRLSSLYGKFAQGPHADVIGSIMDEALDDLIEEGRREDARFGGLLEDLLGQDETS